MAGPPLRNVGPEDVDDVGDLVGKVGVTNKAHKVIKQVADSYPPELVTAQTLQVHKDRTAALDEKEVDKAVSDVDGDLKVLSATVHGLDADNAFVVVAAELKSGRVRKLHFPYSDFSKSQKAAADAGDDDAATKPKKKRAAKKKAAESDAPDADAPGPEQGPAPDQGTSADSDEE